MRHPWDPKKETWPAPTDSYGRPTNHRLSELEKADLHNKIQEELRTPLTRESSTGGLRRESSNWGKGKKPGSRKNPTENIQDRIVGVLLEDKNNR
ncbi:hypothetical protein N9J72_02725 [Candidatus Gracilibacteria bacterium]|nr:hypothetical protein [Candidatus Gracilibacteria bacterium]